MVTLSPSPWNVVRNNWLQLCTTVVDLCCKCHCQYGHHHHTQWRTARHAKSFRFDRRLLEMSFNAFSLFRIDIVYNLIYDFSRFFIIDNDNHSDDLSMIIDLSTNSDFVSSILTHFRLFCFLFLTWKWCCYWQWILLYYCISSASPSGVEKRCWFIVFLKRTCPTFKIATF